MIAKRWRDLSRRWLEAQRILGWTAPFISAIWLARPKYLIYARDLGTPLPPRREGPLTHWTILTESDIPAVSAIDPAMTRSEIERRFGDGQVANLGWSSSELAYYYWDTRRSTLLTYLNRRVIPLPGQIVPCGAFTAERFRNRGIHLAATIESCYRKRDRGADTAIFFVAWWHSPSIRVLTRDVGARLVGSIGFWRLGIRRHYFVGGAARLDTSMRFRIDSEIVRELLRDDPSRPVYSST